MALNSPIMGANPVGAQVVSSTAVTPDQGYEIAKAEAEKVLSQNKLSWSSYTQSEGPQDKVVGGRQGNLNLRKPYMAYLGWSVQNCKVYDPSGSLSALDNVPETTTVIGMNQIPQTIPLRSVVAGMLESYAKAAVQRDENVCKYCFELLGKGEASAMHYLTRHPDVCGRLLGFPSPEVVAPLPPEKEHKPFVPNASTNTMEMDAANIEGYNQTPTVEEHPEISRLENVRVSSARMEDKKPRQCMVAGCGRIFVGEGGYRRHYTRVHKGQEPPSGKE